MILSDKEIEDLAAVYDFSGLRGSMTFERFLLARLAGIPTQDDLTRKRTERLNVKEYKYRGPMLNKTFVLDKSLEV